MRKERSRSRSRDRHKSRRQSSHERDHKRHRSDSYADKKDRRDEPSHYEKHDRRGSPDGGRTASVPQQADPEAEKKRLRLEKLAAWKANKTSSTVIPGAPSVQPVTNSAANVSAATLTSDASAAASRSDLPSSKPVWTPWDDPAFANVSAPVHPPAPPGAAPGAATATEVPGYMAMPAVPKSVVRRRAEFEMEQAKEQYKKQLGADDEEDDALDAFMATEIMPEVSAKQQAEKERLEAERNRKIALLAEGKKLPKEPAVAGDSDSEEETPDEEFEIPAHKVKLMIGAGGEKIKLIQRRTKARIQVKKDAKELTQAFGTTPKFAIPVRGVQKTEDGDVKMVTVMLFGDKEQRRKAREMIAEAIDNKEQKAKQRHQQAERKREAKARDRQMYHLRHTRDYEALGVAIGTDKAGIKKAYRGLAKVWHPDKHPDNQEEAKAKFQEIARAFEALMTTDEDAQILSLAGNNAADKRAAQKQAAAAGVRMRPEGM